MAFLCMGCGGLLTGEEASPTSSGRQVYRFVSEAFQDKALVEQVPGFVATIRVKTHPPENQSGLRLTLKTKDREQVIQPDQDGQFTMAKLDPDEASTAELLTQSTNDWSPFGRWKLLFNIQSAKS